MLSSPSTDALVALEDDSPDVLFETIRGTDLNIWPLCRVPLARWSGDEALGIERIPKTANGRATASRLESVKRLMTLQFRLDPHTPGRIQRHRDVLFVAGGGTFQQAADGRHNWLIDEFAKSLDGNAVVLQDRRINPREKAERPLFRDTYSFIDTGPRIDLGVRFSPTPQTTIDSALRVVDEIIAQYPFPVPDAVKRRVRTQVAGSVRRAPHLEREYQKVLDRVQPTHLVMDGASYTSRAVLTKLLRERGIRLIEPQHGWIGPSHGAYNFGRAMSQPELKRYLPDQLMTFGEFWSDEIRHPSEMVPIGKPHLERYVDSREAHDQIPTVLIVSSTYQRDLLMDLAVTLRDHLPTSWQILVRPHPSERGIVESLFAKLARQDRIELDTNTDVYESLSVASAVIGHSSTVLYEALAFNVPALVIDSPLADLYAPVQIFGERVTIGATTPSEIASRILSGPDSLVSPRVLERIWKPHAVKNFRQLMSGDGAD